MVWVIKLYIFNNKSQKIQNIFVHFLLKNKLPFRKVSTFAKGLNHDEIIAHPQKKCNSFSEISKNSAKIYEWNGKK